MRKGFEFATADSMIAMYFDSDIKNELLLQIGAGTELDEPTLIFVPKNILDEVINAALRVQNDLAVATWEVNDGLKIQLHSEYFKSSNRTMIYVDVTHPRDGLPGNPSLVTSVISLDSEYHLPVLVDIYNEIFRDTTY